jgi:DNA invertase Pin-like site-specific DNA recombinase
MIIGYARVSTTEQNLDLRRDALRRAGCEKIIEEMVSGGKVQRPGLERVHDALRSGDVLAVWRLDRLGRSLKHLIELMAELEAERFGFQRVTESIDTTTSGGKLVFHIVGALAEFERNLIRERTYAGLAAARAGGRKGGRRKSLATSSVPWPSTCTVRKNTRLTKFAWRSASQGRRSTSMSRRLATDDVRSGACGAEHGRN